MKLLIPGKQAIFLFYKQRQCIFIDAAVLVKIIFPDKASLFPVFTDRGISDQVAVFVNSIHVKNKYAVLIQIVRHQGKYLRQIFLFQQIVQGIADTHHRSHSSVQFKLPHILLQIQDAIIRMVSGDLQHFCRSIHTDHVIPFLPQQPCHGSGAAAQIQHQPI